MKKQQKIIIICLAAVIIAASVIVFIAGRKDDPPKLTVSNELGIEISARLGTYTWKTGLTSDESSDSLGPLFHYKAHVLPHIEASENDNYSLTLEFDKKPDSVAVAVYPESAADAQDYGRMMSRETAAYRSGYKFTVPSDGIFIVHVYASWSKGECYYEFYTTP